MPSPVEMYSMPSNPKAIPPPSCPPERHSMIECSEARSISDEPRGSVTREMRLAFWPSNASKFRLLKR